jgi:hypothetical protein
VIGVAVVVFLAVLALLAVMEIGLPVPRVLRRLWPWGHDRATGSAPQPPGFAASSGRDVDGERAEALLVADLLAGTLPADRYRQGMAVLAARDALRHPVVVPPDRRT